MKAAILTAPHQLAVAEAPTPCAGPGQVWFRVRACGVCRTDLHIFDGDLPAILLGLILGHQIVGETPQGPSVGVSWMGGTDGSCPYCKRGQENLCAAPIFTGYTV